MDTTQLLQLDLLDHDDGPQVIAYNDVFTVVWPEFAMTEEEFRHELRESGPARRWLVRSEDGAPVGALAVERVRWHGPDAAPLAFALLPPDRWNDSAYLRLLHAAAGFAVDEGFDSLRLLVWDRELCLLDLARGLDGWEEVSREVDVGLDLGVPLPAPRPAPPGIVITTLAERPDVARAAHACLEAAMPDVPGDVQSTILPFDEWLVDRGRPSITDEATFVALDGAEVVGFAELELPAALPEVAWHGFTAVAPTHRGRGIAYALKSTTIEYARSAGLRLLRTENEERNAPMRHINAELGYAPINTRFVLRGPVAALLGSR